MRYYFAPLEGITGYIYRRAHHAFYPGIDKYFTPFIVPKEKKHLSAKERNDVLLQHNENMIVIPQIMTNNAEEFLRISKVLFQDYGYKEINLNLGCPSKTVVSKKRGSGFLSLPDRLEEFLDSVCNAFAADGMMLSVKTRIGVNDPKEFLQLLNIFNRYPLGELIIHPRIQKDFYNNVPRLDVFQMAYESPVKLRGLCYNGDIFTVSDYIKIKQRYPNLSAVMMGRGLLINPMLVEEIKVRENGGGDEKRGKYGNVFRFADEQEEKDERKRRYEMYRRIMEDYKDVMSAEKDVLFKMKELWLYMSQDFTKPQKYLKKMKKAQRLADFEGAAFALCHEQNLKLYD